MSEAAHLFAEFASDEFPTREVDITRVRVRPDGNETGSSGKGEFDLEIAGAVELEI